VSILIANRGEIAVRVIRACHELGLKAVAVYSDADRTAMHVREADAAYPIGPAAATESYLRPEVLIDVALKSNCKAVHPGYGFLAENAEFARQVIEAGLVYIGSSPESIRLLGDKVKSRALMARAGVPLTPGITSGEDLTDERLAVESERIGFPVLVKAAGGGGGKGMRIVHHPDDLISAIAGARREALAAFGSGAVYIEKFITRPRHVEFQVFGDQHGHRVHLFERECSIQRRHQKIIEESPSPALDDDLRHRMGAAAVQVITAANYTNAGTVEFLLDEDRSFYFLEVNTRIQVEHPVTEMVTGIDLVAEQIRVAFGAELSFGQNDLHQHGHAVEARIYAEDARHNFLPSAGPVHYLKEPRGPGIRFDGGVESGDEVTVHYDPIVAKLIAHAPTRKTAVNRLSFALKETAILGLTTNIDFLLAVLEHPAFRSGDLTTNFIAEHLAGWKPPVSSGDERNIALLLAGLAASKHLPSEVTASDSTLPDPWAVLGRWEIASGAR